MNKVQRINFADTGEFLKWKQGVCFAFYGWNEAPINGTDIAQSTVAVGCEFSFPIDLNTGTIPRATKLTSQQAINYFDAASPLLYKQ